VPVELRPNAHRIGQMLICAADAIGSVTTACRQSHVKLDQFELAALIEISAPAWSRGDFLAWRGWSL